MSSTVLLEKAVVTDTAIAAKKSTEHSLKSMFPKLHDRVTAKLLIRSVGDSVLLPILKQKPSKIAKTFDDSVDLFGITMIALEQLILKNNRDKLTELFESDREFYRQCTETIDKHRNWIGHSNQDQIKKIVDVFQDYQNVIVGILMKKPELPANALEAMNQREWLTSLYGTILSIFCIFKVISTPRYHDLRKLEALVAVGKKYSEALDGYSDTVDILTNAEEKELMSKAEKL